jgi:site-specific recombinase XerD
MGTLALFKPAQVARIERDPVAVYLGGLSITGRRSMAQKLTVAAQLLAYVDAHAVDWANFKFEHVAAIKTRLIESRRAPATINATLAALRGVAKAAWALGLLSSDKCRLILTIKSVRGSRLPSGRALSAGEVSALFRVCFDDETPAGRRDAAILALLLGAGLRRTECADLAMRDYNAESQAVTVRGKGDKERTLPVEESTDQAVRDWLQLRGDWSGPLLCRVRKNGTVEQEHISAEAIYQALAKRGRESKVARFSPHDLRKTYASGLIDISGDILTVSRLLGHASIQTTALYDRRGEAAKRKVVNAYHLPYTTQRNPD